MLEGFKLKFYIINLKTQYKNQFIGIYNSIMLINKKNKKT